MTAADDARAGWSAPTRGCRAMRPVRAASIAAVLPVLASGACRGDAGDRPHVYETSPEAALELEWAIGENLEAVADYQFASIAGLLPTSQGIVWVIDGAGSGHTPLIRQFDSSGAFIRQVGGQGMGPGEYLAPQGLAELHDGRIVMRDQQIPHRLTVYHPDGSLAATWPLDRPYTWPSRGRTPIRVTRSGLISIPTRPSVRPGPDRTIQFLMLAPSGEIMNTVPAPEVPEIPRVSIQGMVAPYQPAGVWVDDGGASAVARTDEYKIETSVPLWPAVTRDVPPVLITEEERRAITERMRADLERLEVGGGVELPDPPNQKPILRGIDWALDNRLIVYVSMPSTFQADEWREPLAFDVFDRERGYEGRVVLRDGFAFRGTRLRGDYVWAVHESELGVMSVRQYRVAWPSKSRSQP
jgi:hypothetical protein